MYLMGDAVMLPISNCFRRLCSLSQGCPADYSLLGCYADSDSNRLMPNAFIMAQQESMSTEVPQNLAVISCAVHMQSFAGMCDSRVCGYVRVCAIPGFWVQLSLAVVLPSPAVPAPNGVVQSHAWAPF